MSDDATIAVIDALEALGVPYMIVGSLSTNFYGVARATRDADFVLELTSVPISRIVERIGPDVRLEPQMSFETVTGTPKYVLTLAGGHFKFEFFLLSTDAHDQERFRRRRRETVEGRGAFVPAVEDVIVTKVRWAHRAARPKDIEDIRNVIVVQHDAIDGGYVYGWCERHGTRSTLDQIRTSLGGV